MLMSLQYLFSPLRVLSFFYSRQRHLTLSNCFPRHPKQFYFPLTQNTHNLCAKVISNLVSNSFDWMIFLFNFEYFLWSQFFNIYSALFVIFYMYNSQLIFYLQYETYLHSIYVSFFTRSKQKRPHRS